MIHPSYQELIATINEGQDLDEAPVVSSRYSLVLATSKRARQIIGGAEPLVKVKKGMKPLSIAVVRWAITIRLSSDIRWEASRTLTQNVRRITPIRFSAIWAKSFANLKRSSQMRVFLSLLRNFVLVAMEIALRTFFKMNLAHHKVIRVA